MELEVQAPVKNLIHILRHLTTSQAPTMQIKTLLGVMTQRTQVHSR
jgi:hypothetical protein